MNRFKFSNIHFLELKRNSAICAFISLSHFVTSGKKYLEEQVVKKKVIVFASKIKNKTKLTKTTTIITKKKKRSITALSKAEKYQWCWFKDRRKASFITKRHKPLFVWVLQLDNTYKNTTFQGAFWVLVGCFGLFWRFF